MADNAPGGAVERVRGAIGIVEGVTGRATCREKPEVVRGRLGGLVVDVLVANGAIGVLRRIMALQAVAVGGRAPSAAVTQRLVVLVAAQAGILFMACCALLAVPCCTQPVTLPAPGDRVALGRVLAMAILA